MCVIKREPLQREVLGNSRTNQPGNPTTTEPAEEIQASSGGLTQQNYQEAPACPQRAIKLWYHFRLNLQHFYHRTIFFCPNWDYLHVPRLYPLVIFRFCSFFFFLNWHAELSCSFPCLHKSKQRDNSTTALESSQRGRTFIWKTTAKGKKAQPCCRSF